MQLKYIAYINEQIWTNPMNALEQMTVELQP